MSTHVSKIAFGILLATFVFVGVSVPGHAYAATLTELENQLKKAEADLARYQDLQKNEQNKAQTYEKEISQTQQEINQVRGTIGSLESQIQTKNKEIDDTTRDIIKKSEDLTNLNNSLDSSLASLYELTDYSQLEVAASGKNLSQYSDRAEYMQALQGRILDDITTANKIKQDLEGKNTQLNARKNELAELKGDQEQKNAELVSEKKEQASLLNTAKINQATYQAQAKKLEEQKNILSKEIYELRKKLTKGSAERLVISTTSYPFQVGPNVWRADPWDFYMSECTSYAAWKWYVHYGSGFRPSFNGTVGDGYNWPTIARQQGYQTSSTPRKNSVISWNRAQGMPYGHVAWVENVNPDGTIDITEYNWVSAHKFSRREGVSYQKWGSATFIYK